MNQFSYNISPSISGQTDYGKIPTQEAYAHIALKFYQDLYNDAEVRTLGDMQEAMLKKGAFGFFNTFREYYPDVFLDIVQKEFSYVNGNKYHDFLHTLVHIINEEAHTYDGEVRMPVGELVIWGITSPLEFMTHRGSLSPTTSLKTIKEIIDRSNEVQNDKIRQAESILNLQEGALDSDHKLTYSMDEYGNLDLDRSPQVLKCIVQASYRDFNFEEITGKKISATSLTALMKTSKETLAFTDEMRQEVRDIIDHNTNPHSKITLESFSPIAREVQSYVEKLKASVRKEVKEPVISI